MASTKFLRRARTIRSIAARARYPVTLILAPAGSGKSVALDQFLAESSETHVRFSVARGRDRLLDFSRSLAGAVGLRAPRALYEAIDAHGDLSAARELAARMHERGDRFPGIVAIDDLHHTEGDRAVAAFLEAMVALTKHSTKWILVSRSAQPPVSSWLVYGDADIPIQGEDLRFTHDEARAAAALCRAQLSDDELARSVTVSSGWAAGVGLLLRSAAHAPVERADHIARELSYAYLREHVWEWLTSAERDLLMFSTLLPEFDAQTVEAAGFPHAIREVRDLHARGMFLTLDSLAAAEGRTNVYRYNGLFFNFLQHELSLLELPRRNEFHLRAAEVAEHRFGAPAALRLYTQSNRYDDVLRILTAHALEPSDGVDEEIVASSIAALPDDLRADAVVLALQAEQCRRSGDFACAEMLFERAIAQADTSKVRGMAIRGLSAARLRAGKAAGKDLLAAAFDRDLPAGMRCELQSLLALSDARFGDTGRARALACSVEATADTVDAKPVRARISYWTGMAFFACGDVDAAIASLARAATLSDRCGMAQLSSEIYRTLGRHWQACDEFGRARECSNASIRAASACGDERLLREGLILSATLFAHDGNDRALRRIVRRLQGTARTQNAPDDYAMAELNSWVAAWDGSFQLAFELIGRAKPGTCDGVAKDVAFMAGLAAVYAAAAGLRDEATRAIERALAQARERSPHAGSARARQLCILLCALAETLNGRPAASRRLLARTPDADSEALRAVRDCVTSLVRVCGRAGSGILPQAALQTLRACGYGGLARTLGALTETLHARESKASLTATQRAVLAALSAGAAPKDIAVEFGCSVYTVRAHIRAAIAKFGCSGSDQAIRIARAHNVI